MLVEALKDVSGPDAHHQSVRGQQIDALVALTPREDDTDLQALAAADMPFDTDLVEAAEFSADSGQEAMEAALRRAPWRYSPRVPD